jgi:hypothetical protein
MQSLSSSPVHWNSFWCKSSSAKYSFASRGVDVPRPYTAVTRGSFAGLETVSQCQKAFFLAKECVSSSEHSDLASLISFTDTLLLQALFKAARTPDMRRSQEDVYIGRYRREIGI